MAQDVPEQAYNNPQLLKQSKGMNSSVWHKQTNVAFPGWAMKALSQPR